MEFRKIIVQTWIQNNLIQENSLKDLYSKFLGFCKEISDFVNSINHVFDGLEFSLWTSAGKNKNL